MIKRCLLLFGFVGLHLSVLYSSVPIANLLAALTGSIALSCMALSVCLAARCHWVDALCGGPDRSYKLHRWLGYGAMIGTLLHWPLAEGMLPGAVPVLEGIAGDSGEFAAIMLLTLAVVSALKLVPYHWWKKSHFLMGPVYLIAVFHSVFSASPFSVNSHAWWAVLGVSLLGVVGWLATLIRRSKNSVQGTVIALHKTENRTDVTLSIPTDFRWQPGQFVNLAVKREGLAEYHPFSFASASGSETARFIIKPAGDFTRLLHQDISMGDKVFLKEVAGKFHPQTGSSRKPQVWASAGAGITPFLASLDAMSADKGASVDLLYCCDSVADASLIEELKLYATRLPQLKLHLFMSGRRLNAEYLNKQSASWQGADLYICGPDMLKKLLIPYWQQKSSKGCIHHEDFDFRNGINLPSLQHKLKPVFLDQVSRYLKGRIDAYSRT